MQADGKIVAAGYIGGDVAVARFNTDGSLDTTFDGDGIAVTDFGGDNDRVLDVTIQSDGKIVIAGKSRGVNSRGDLIVGRYNVNGSLDTSFDGDGKVKLDFGDGDQGFGVELDSSGNVVVGGITNTITDTEGDLLVVRLNANGSLDTGFDADGSRVIDLGGTKQGIVLGMALDHQGRIVLGGNTKDGTDVKGLLVRLTSAGAHDTSFSADGVVEEDFGGADEFNHVAVDDRGRVVVAGNGGTNGAHATSGTDAVAARYTDAGALDTTFGASGKRHVDFGGASDDAEDMALDPFGRVVIAGDDGGTDYAVGRLTADGTVDTSFDTDGVAKIDFGGTSEDGQAVAIQTDGRILAVGRTGDDFAVARLSGGGTRNYAVQDANFNTTAVTDATGKVLERYQYDPYGSAAVLNADFSVDADGKQDVNLPYLWQGGALVTATGVYHFRHRDVDPRLGRATQADPWRQDPSRPQAGDGYPDGMSRYEWEGSNPVARLDPLGLYEVDFHYYVVYYLMRARGYTPEVADRVAGASQYVDDNPNTDPVGLGMRGQTGSLRDYHFPGSGPNTPTRRDDPGSRIAATAALKQLFETLDSNYWAQAAGRWLHTYADSWAHEGFTAWWNSAINKRTGSMRPNVGHADAADGGHAPDSPYNDYKKALDAAKHIYDAIPPNAVGSPEWDALREELLRAWMVTLPPELEALKPPGWTPDLELRTKMMQNAIKERFGEDAQYDVEKARRAYESRFDDAP